MLPILDIISYVEYWFSCLKSCGSDIIWTMGHLIVCVMEYLLVDLPVFKRVISIVMVINSLVGSPVGV